MERDVDAIRLPQWGRVGEIGGVVPYEVQDTDGQPIEPVRRYLRDFVAQGRRAGSIRSYAYDLLRWWRWLQVVDVEWDKVTSAEVREFVLWLQRSTKPRRTPRTKSASTVGTINSITRKQYPGDRYAARTIRHSNAVIRSFYEFWIERGDGPLVNPVPQQRRGERRPNAHHNPLEPFRPEGRLRYNPPVPKRRPRAMSDHLWEALFAAMRSDRDQALASLGDWVADQVRFTGAWVRGGAGRQAVVVLAHAVTAPRTSWRTMRAPATETPAPAPVRDPDWVTHRTRTEHE
ncbi:hypothetical protein CD790_22240 [Streptomyces sp. SAJ15]|nr:hypothetical protein CD790_22240 [Streptomyces sp. SAJ15]